MSLVSAQKFTHGRFCAREATVVRAALPAGASRCTAHGSMLLELCAALALVAAAAAALLGGLRPLACAFQIEAARSALVDAMLEARRLAYENESTVAIATAVGSNSVRVGPAGHARPLGDHTSITAGPSDGSVAFRGTGLADNATVSIACGSATASVVVNQRGVVR